jgi:hypothetical protein
MGFKGFKKKIPYCNITLIHTLLRLYYTIKPNQFTENTPMRSEREREKLVGWLEYNNAYYKAVANRICRVNVVTQEKSFDLGSGDDPRVSPTAVNPWLEICQLKRISQNATLCRVKALYFWQGPCSPTSSSTLPRSKLFFRVTDKYHTFLCPYLYDIGHW